ncbi:ABC transporter permease [Asanoa sp. WMMD1127]|uniref:ABC transporter permease n=1 Tax=Asanoa sp. WMMD1127 TaxID=3016107 RepID=UPI0024166DA2|nr:ABC transporter permease [Asanoa sp. WMMD1127]MDG4825231.1 ABC transporter permease [Asanoa sp. WMMD1127]
MTGAGGLLRFMLRRERMALPWWLLGATVLVLVQSTQSQNLYDTPEDLAKLRQTLGGNAAVIAMSGPVRLLETIGGEVAFEILAFVSIVVALMNMFLVGRHTRADEESGRAELVRSARVGRRAPLAAALALAGLADLAVAVLLFAVTAGTGLPVGGSVLFGVSVATVGLTFAALTAVAVQVFENLRAAYGAVGLAIGAAFVLRAAGDAGNGTLSWLSPIGWAQRTFPYVDNRWWPLLFPVATTAVLTAAAMALLERRDFGAGLVRSRPGRPYASPALRSSLGLAWRLQRGSLVGWALGLFLLGTAYGSIGDSIEQYVADNPEVVQFLPGGAADIVDAFLGLTLLTLAVITAAYAVTVALRARAEETSGRAEPVLATATSRAAWIGSHLSVAVAGSALVLVAAGAGEGLAYGLTVDDLGQVPRLLGVALGYLPAVLLVAAVAVLAIGWLPRAASVVAWVMVAYCAVIALFADSFDIPEWLQRGSPFAHTPQAPLDALTPTPLVLIALVAVVLAASGYAGLRRRDLGY